jgi:hypothetical protein
VYVYFIALITSIDSFIEKKKFTFHRNKELNYENEIF